MMTTVNITISPSATYVGGKFSNFSMIDLSTAADAIIAMRTVAHTQSCLANHMGREELEDLFDCAVADFGSELDEIERELLFRLHADKSDVADIEDLLLKIAFTTRPGVRGWDIRARQVQNDEK